MEKHSKILAFLQNLVISYTILPFPPPPWVQKGTIILPERSYWDRKVAIGGAIVLH